MELVLLEESGLGQIQETHPLVGEILESRLQGVSLFPRSLRRDVVCGFGLQLPQEVAGVAEEGFHVGPDLRLDGLALDRLGRAATLDGAAIPQVPIAPIPGV